jgi:hypothetical protein
MQNFSVIIAIFLAVFGGVIINNKRIDDLGVRMDKRIDDLKDFIRSEVKRLEERIDRITHEVTK